MMKLKIVCLGNKIKSAIIAPHQIMTRRIII